MRFIQAVQRVWKRKRQNEGGECEKEKTGIFIFIFYDIRGICGVLVACTGMERSAVRSDLYRHYFI